MVKVWRVGDDGSGLMDDFLVELCEPFKFGVFAHGNERVQVGEFGNDSEAKDVELVLGVVKDGEVFGVLFDDGKFLVKEGFCERVVRQGVRVGNGETSEDHSISDDFGLRR